jgi:hypothetical protein
VGVTVDTLLQIGLDPVPEKVVHEQRRPEGNHRETITPEQLFHAQDTVEGHLTHGFIRRPHARVQHKQLNLGALHRLGEVAALTYQPRHVAH